MREHFARKIDSLNAQERWADVDEALNATMPPDVRAKFDLWDRRCRIAGRIYVQTMAIFGAVALAGLLADGWLQLALVSAMGFVIGLVTPLKWAWENSRLTEVRRK